MAKPKDSTVRKLFALSRNLCAFPGCTNTIIDSRTNVIIGEICHICAQSSEGPRFSSNQSEEERQAFENLILLCPSHHKIIDDRSSIEEFTAEYLFDLKHQHEKNTSKSHTEAFAISEAIVLELLDTIKTPQTSNVHMDFRGATLKAGGEGGKMGGEGGKGGTINIVGVTPSGFHEKIDGNGESAKFPGAGGGGGGVVNYSGRPIDKTDLELGLHVSSIFLVESINYSKSGLFNILGGGPLWFDIENVPSNFMFRFFYSIDTGSVALNTLLKINYKLIDPEEKLVYDSHFDLAIEDIGCLVRRYSSEIIIVTEFSKIGVWKLIIASENAVLATYAFELRSKKKSE